MGTNAGSDPDITILIAHDEYSGRWEYSFIIPPNLEQINFVFNDGQNNWDNNNGNDWNLNVQNMLLGDVNFDNNINIQDVLMILDMDFGFGYGETPAADYNADGIVNTSDWITLVQFIINN